MYPSDGAQWRAALIGIAVLLGLLLSAQGFAAQRTVVLIPGDPATRALVAAMAQLRADSAQAPQLASIHFRILSSSAAQLTDAELQAIADADLFIINNPGRNLLNRIGPSIKSMTQRGGKAYALGSPVDGLTEMGFVQDQNLRAYFVGGGADNLAAMLRTVLSREFGLYAGATIAAPRAFPSKALWNPRSNRLFETFDDYAADYLASRPGAGPRPWIGVVFNRVSAQSGGSALIESVMAALEQRGYNVAPAFGYPSDVPAQEYFVDAQGRPRTAAIVALAMKMGHQPDTAAAALQRVDVPIVNAISLYDQTVAEWQASKQGLSLTERLWQVATSEFAGTIAPTVVAAKETRRDAETGLEYIVEAPIAERIERLADRIDRWAQLRRLPNARKKVAVIYYNYPPGKENIGASYLNVLPRSLWQILSRLQREGYDVGSAPRDEQALFELLREHGANVGNWAPGALEQLVRGGHAVLWPVSEYRRWFDRQPQALRADMIRSWGEPEKSDIMTWRDSAGTPYFVLPLVKFGNILLGPQPSRGNEQHVDKLYHDVSVPPHHQYLAFYLWLQKQFDVNAMVHVGTHASHEWLSGKEIGFTPADPPEAMVADVPQLYPYIVDDIGEALQAKRRGMAAVISHLTPPFDKAHLNVELSRLKQALDDYGVAAQKSASAAAGHLQAINELAGKTGMLKDIGLNRVGGADDVERLEHYLKEILERDTPYGLHTFGVAAPAKLRRSTAEAILGMAPPLPAAEHAQRRDALSALLQRSAAAELDALMAGLAGRYIASGPGNDPLRNPASLPTGRNLYGFDPDTLPTRGAWEQGAALAKQFVDDYRQRHGQYPDRVVFNLWSTETMRNEGATEAEIFALMGVRPRWDQRDRVIGLEVIARDALGRPRVDVTVVPSGLYRDSLPNLMQLLDNAVTLAKALREDDNPIRANVQKVQKILEQRGIAASEAERLATVRVFSEPSGAYGTGLNAVIQASNTWDDDAKVADVYFNRAGHLFGQGFWGERPGDAGLAVDLFKLALKGAKAAIHSRSSHLYGTLDNDDVLQYLGGTALAIRQVNGAAPETVILNLANKDGARHETLDQYLGREMRTRYTNPEWIKAMLDEGYAGARFIMKTTEYLWGWQVTNPEVIDASKWQEMYETYVADRNQLNIRERFRKAQNLLAYQAIVDKMLVAVNKGYWKPEAKVREHLEQLNRELIAEAGVACNAHSCSSAEVTAAALEQDRRALREALAKPAPAPSTQGLTPATAVSGDASATPPAGAQSRGAAADLTAPADAGAEKSVAPNESPRNTAAKAAQTVAGYEMKEQKRNEPPGGPAQDVIQWTLFGCLALMLLGFVWSARRPER